MHVPVLIQETISLLHLTEGSIVVDATIGDGGHAQELLGAVGSTGILVGIDRDAQMLERARKRLALFERQVYTVAAPFSEIKEVAASFGITQVHAILFDLGISSWHLEESGRGFSFMRTHEPLDMRFDAHASSVTAQDILAHSTPEQLEKIFREFGEVGNAKILARVVSVARQRSPLRRVGDLVDILRRAARIQKFERYAAQVFQALRIAVNDELEIVRAALPPALSLLTPGGRIAVISYHSLEDRSVKQFFRSSAAHNTIRLITKKPVTPSPVELMSNPRARSAKLRVAEKQ